MVEASGSHRYTAQILQVTPWLNYGEWPHRTQHGSSYMKKLRHPLPGSVLLARLLPAAGWLGSRDSNGSSGGGGRGGRVCVCAGERGESPERSLNPQGVEAPAVEPCSVCVVTPCLCPCSPMLPLCLELSGKRLRLFFYMDLETQGTAGLTPSPPSGFLMSSTSVPMRLGSP